MLSEVILNNSSNLRCLKHYALIYPEKVRQLAPIILLWISHHSEETIKYIVEELGPIDKRVLNKALLYATNIHNMPNANLLRSYGAKIERNHWD